ncbi:MAG: isoprenylcysteine carboxylmethyltransferase family protein [Bacteroidetes bacterium]|nr:isoprenylcysteine carboxylmethyltransferase family protein [Bacteroidota bacterium]
MEIKKLASRVAYVFYGMIMLEGILMATPFGLFLYSFYLPFLEGVRQSVLTAWIAAFFLPHSVVATSSTLIEFLRWKGLYLFVIGLIGFFVFAIQVYWAKFRRKGMVKNFVYSYIRHPQYLFFMLSGVGLLFMWPRMMMLILFTMMSIFYFYLAKFEESKMQAKHPEYLEYMKKTAMFIPGNPGGKIFNLLFGWIPNQKVAQLIATVLVIILIFGGSIGLRNLTIANTSITKIPDKNIMAISIFPHTEQYLRDAVYKTMAYDSVQKALSEQGNISFTAHIMPSNYGMLGMFAEISEAELSAKRQQLMNNLLNLKDWAWGTESDKVKVVFSKIDKPGKKFVPLNEIMDMSAKMTPVLVADLNLAAGEVINVTMTSTTHFGDVPQPIF